MKIPAEQISLGGYKRVKDPNHYLLVWLFTPIFLIFGGAVVASLVGAELGIVFAIGLACFPLFYIAVLIKRLFPRKCPVGGERMIRITPYKRNKKYKVWRQVCKKHKVYLETEFWQREYGS